MKTKKVKKAVVEKSKAPRRMQVGLIIDDKVRYTLKKYCIYRDMTIPQLLQELINKWYKQHMEIDPNFIETLKENEYEFIDFVDEQLKLRTKNEEYKQI